jgi:hypothetical protein
MNIVRQAKDDSEIPGTVAYEAARADRLQDRIEALEAALRKIAEFPYVGEKAAQQMALIAKTALAPEQDQEK